MCGRFAFFASRKRLKKEFCLSEPETALTEFPARYNIAPGQEIPAVRQLPRQPREIVFLHWGLVPSWAKDIKSGYRMINARAESITTKPAFKNAFRYRRCLIPSSGFYEWQKKNGKKQPWFITLKDKDLFAFAGLWERWQNPETGKIVESCTIITTDSNELVKPLHDRMPAIIPPEKYDAWLNPATKPEGLLYLLGPFPSSKMTAWPVSPLVNNPKHDSPECIRSLV